MKTSQFKIKMILGLLVFLNTIPALSQKNSLAILSINSNGILTDRTTLTNITHMEMEKTNKYEVLDKYDVGQFIEENGIDLNNCYGKNCLVEAGKLLKADYMLTGSVERFGEKIVVTLRIIDVNMAVIEKTEVSEYLNLETELQSMIKISVNNLLGIENDQNMVNMLVNYERPISSPKTKLKLNGTRMGATYFSGENSKRLMASKREGGFNMFPLTSMFGYQHEVQYLSSGDFSGLFEMLFAVNGLESGVFIPSITFMNGFRFDRGGYEFGIGPNFRFVKLANGYYDENNKWHMANEVPEGSIYEIEEQIDRRGDLKFSTGLVIAVGKTFRSGYLNIPVNLYVVPRKGGSTYGFSIGFNIAKRPSL